MRPDTNDAHSFNKATAFLKLPDGNTRAAVLKRKLWNHLNPLERVLLATDGSFTLLLGAITNEPIKTVPLTQSVHTLEQPHTQLQLETGDRILKRHVLLKAASSDRTLVYGASTIVLSRLSSYIRQMLAEGSKPIGLLLRQAGIETHRELHDWGRCETSHFAAKHLSGQTLLFRTSIAYANGLPLMVVSEYFTEALSSHT